jgi:hypothetical protein
MGCDQCHIALNEMTSCWGIVQWIPVRPISYSSDLLLQCFSPVCSLAWFEDHCESDVTVACPKFEDWSQSLRDTFFINPCSASSHTWPPHYYCLLLTWAAVLLPCQHFPTCTDALQVKNISMIGNPCYDAWQCPHYLCTRSKGPPLFTVLINLCTPTSH